MKYRVPYIHSATDKNDPFKIMKVERLEREKKEKIKDETFREMVESIGKK